MNPRYSRLTLLILVAVTIVGVRAQNRPSLAAYYTEIPQRGIDSGYAPLSIFPVTEDLNGDGYQDLVVLGANYPGSALVNVPQPGRVFLGDNNGNFAPAPADLFPVDTLMTVHPRKVLFADFNADGLSDMFISSHGWDVAPFPGEQNRLYLSRPEGGWRDATDTLPQILDFSHSSAVGDISGRGLIDIFVGNQGQVPPYVLTNSGSGLFSMTRANIPVAGNQLLDPLTYHTFLGATLADLNDDGLPELIVTGDSSTNYKKLRQSTILWNRAGVFVETDTTSLPVPEIFKNIHIDHDAQPIDVNQDGLMDLLVVGTQAIPDGRATATGWFVQILINKGNRVFVDETAALVPPGESSAGIEGVETPTPWAQWVKVLDFNQDGFPDFTIEFSATSAVPLTQDQPLIWLNDGTGHFSTLKVGDFVAPGQEALLGTRPHLVPTRNGYSFVSLKNFGTSGGLRLVVLLATKPYRITPPVSQIHD